MTAQQPSGRGGAVPRVEDGRTGHGDTSAWQTDRHLQARYQTVSQYHDIHTIVHKAKQLYHGIGSTIHPHTTVSPNHHLHHRVGGIPLPRSCTVNTVSHLTKQPQPPHRRRCRPLIPISFPIPIPSICFLLSEIPCMRVRNP